MPTTTINPVFDGSTAVDRLQGQSQVEWDVANGFLGYYSVFESTANTDLVANVTLSGSNWTAAVLRFGAGTTNTTNLSDMDDSEGRRIDLLKLGSNSDVELISTRVRYMYGDDGEKHDITLGSQWTGSVNLGADLNVVTTGTGWTSIIEVWNGRAVITVGTGGAGAIETSDGNDKIVANGYVRSIATNGGNDTIQTGADYVHSIIAGDGRDIIRTGDGGAGAIDTSDGNDKVFTGKGYVEAIRTGDGNDLVTLGGGGGVGIVKLGAGNDRLVVGEFDDPFSFVVIQGGSGTDTVDFGKYSVGAVFSLDLASAGQNPGAPGGALDTGGKGLVAESSFENIRGSRKSDDLTGDGNNNVLVGKNGGDKLYGLNGNDKLNGGGGNDKLYGGGDKDFLQGGKGGDVLAGGEGDDRLKGQAGRDVFVFGENGGRDTVLDYTDGVDKLRIEGHQGGFQSLDIGAANGDKIIHYDGGVIVLDGDARANLTAADFIFV